MNNIISRKVAFLLPEKTVSSSKYILSQYNRITLGIDFYLIGTNFSSKVLDTIKEYNILSLPSIEDFKTYILEHKLSYDLIDTSSEVYLQDVNKLKRELGLSFTKNFLGFSNKGYQRDILKKSSYSIQYEKYQYNQIDTPSFTFPYIIKPVVGSLSKGVTTIYNKKDLDSYNFSQSRYYVIEEYIKGDMYSIDYYVTSTGTIYLYPLVKVLCLKDNTNVIRIVNQETDELFLNRYNDIYKFIKEQVDLLGARDTIIHHELKITKTGSLKTIEVNGRLGGNRPKIYKEAYDIEYFDFYYLNPQLSQEKVDSLCKNISLKREVLFTTFKSVLLDTYKLDEYTNLRTETYPKNLLISHRINTLDKYKSKKKISHSHIYNKGKWCNDIIYLLLKETENLDNLKRE